jgi:hypothetical protein
MDSGRSEDDMKGLGWAVLWASAMLPVLTLAQDGSAKFWLKGSSDNLQGCLAADPQFTREHTITVQNGQATVTSAGGINTRMKLVRPDVYETSFVLGQLDLNVVADLAATPKSLTVTDRNLGCRWSAVKE